MLAATREVEVHVVLLLSDQSCVDEFGQSAFLALSEAIRLYAVDDGQLLTIPVDDERDIAVQPRITRSYAGPAALDGEESVLDRSRLQELTREVALLATEAPAPLRSLVDQRALIALVSEALAIDTTPLVVVTDRPIHPPPDWRYLIWDPVPGGVAVSFATLDPRYWGEQLELPERRQAVRRRLRAALCSVLGTCLGLVRCDNPWCFLYADVDRVSRLDHFVHIGEEHRVEALSRRGFATEAADEALEEAVAEVDEPLA